MAEGLLPCIIWVLSIPRKGESLPTAQWVFMGHPYDFKD